MVMARDHVLLRSAWDCWYWNGTNCWYWNGKRTGAVGRAGNKLVLNGGIRAGCGWHLWVWHGHMTPQGE